MNKEKHYEELLFHCIDYLWEIWNNVDLETIEKKFRRLGFTDKDLEEFEIKEELLYLEEYNNAFGKDEE